MSILAVSVFAFDEVEKPGEGVVLAGEGDGGEQSGAEPGVVRFREGLAEDGKCLWGSGLGDGDGGLGCCVVFGWQEPGCPRDSAGAFEAEDTAIAGSEEFGFATGEFGAETQEEHGSVGADLFDGASCVDLDGEFLVGEQFGEDGEETNAVEIPALDEGEGTCTAEGAGGVGGASPDGFKLDVPHALQEELFLLIFEGSESFGGVVFGPALGVGFDGVLQESAEGGGELRDQSSELEVGGNPSGSGYEEVIAMLQGLAESGLGEVWGSVTQKFEGCRLLFDTGRSGRCGHGQ